MLVPMEPEPLTKAIAAPSGDQAGSNSSAGFEVHCVSFPVATSTTQISKLPLKARSDENAIRFPSGEKDGSRSSAWPSVNCRIPVPSGLISQMWNVPPLND